MDLAEKQQALTNCDVLSTADKAAVRWLADAAQIEQFEENTFVFEEGETSSRVYIVASGSLQIRLGGTAKLISVAEPGSLFGEYAMFVKGARTASLIAAERSVLLSIGADQFREFLLRCPSVTMELLQKAVRRLHRAERPKR